MTMNILHLTYDMRIGGTEMVIKNLISNFDQKSDNESVAEPRYEMSVLCIESPLGPFGEHLVEQGVEVTNLNWQGGFDSQLIQAIRRHLKQHKIDIVHCHQYTPWVYGALAAAFLNVKVVFTEHGRFYPDSTSWKRKLINPILLTLTDHVTAISRATKQALTEFEFIPSPAIDVIYNGIEGLTANEQEVGKIKAELGLPADALIFGTVARLDPIKNQTMMIKAFAAIVKKHPNAYLIIVGDGEEREKLELLIAELDLHQNVILTGYKAKPVNYIGLIDVFLLSSLSEGTSMTLLEAMSLGIPCLVTDAGGNPEVIADGEVGFVSENDNEQAFTHSIDKYLQLDNQQRQLMSDNAKLRFNQRFSQDVMQAKFRAIYSSLVGNKR